MRWLAFAASFVVAVAVTGCAGPARQVPDTRPVAEATGASEAGDASTRDADDAAAPVGSAIVVRRDALSLSGRRPEAEVVTEETCDAGGAADSSCRDVAAGAKDVSAAVDAAAGELAASRPRFSSDDFSDTVVIGDSVVSGAEEAILSAMPGVTVNADPSRTFEVGGVLSGYDPSDGMIDYARSVAGDYHRYVIECGINDAGLTDAMVDEFVDVLAGDGVQLYFVNQLVTDNQSANEETRVAIERIVSERTDTFVVDWLGEGDESDLADDCHLNNAGCDHYAGLICDVVVAHA